MDLSKKRCVPCEGLEKPFDNKQIQRYLLLISKNWEIDEKGRLSQKFKFKDFKQAIKFVNKIAKLAEEQNHHPNIHIYYNQIKITIFTHVIKGLSENDFILASKIDMLY